ncbi:MAG: hypothetical protein EKK45_29785 [Curvibacter sp.]|nr:MAG: hypothetical protein EKK45_29785 [Curvibacter sp.]
MNTPQQYEYPVWMELETLETRLGQLQAMLLGTHGGAFDVFNSLDEPLRDAYLSHCAEFATDLRKQAAALIEQAQQETREAKAKG